MGRKKWAVMLWILEETPAEGEREEEGGHGGGEGK